MAMMASASSSNPYDNYDNTEIEQDLIDPDDGNSAYWPFASYTNVGTRSKY